MRTRSTLAGLSLLVCLTGCVADDTRGSESSAAATTPTSEQKAIPDGTAPIEPGTYRIPASAWSVVDFTVTFPKGWTVQYGHNYLKHEDGDGELGFYAVEVDEIFTDACVGGEEFTEIGPSAYDLAAALLRQPGPKATGLHRSTLGGYPAIVINMKVPKTLDLKACAFEGVGLQIWYSAPADKYFVLLRDGFAEVYILDIDGQRQVFLVQTRAGASQKDRRELDAILDSIHIEA
jgi:hypothetical protein